MSRRLLAAVVLALVVPPSAVAKTTKLDAYSPLEDRPGGLFRIGDPIHVVAHGFIPKVICGAKVRFTLVDSHGSSLEVGSAHPKFDWGEGLINRDIGVVPGGFLGPAKLKSKQLCVFAGAAPAIARGSMEVVIIDPGLPLPRISSTSATNTLAGDKSVVSFALSRDAVVSVAVQFEFVRGQWRDIDASAGSSYIGASGNHKLTWTADAGLPPGHYRFVLTPHAPTVGDGQQAFADFYLGRILVRNFAGPIEARVDPGGGLVVVDNGANALRTVSPSGAVVSNFPVSLLDPRDVSFSGAGTSFTTFVAVAGTRRVLQLVRTSANTLDSALFAGPANFGSKGPQSVAATGSNGGRVYVVDGENPRIQAFDLAGSLAGSLTAGGVFNDPQSVAVAPDGSIWVADPPAALLVHVSPTGAVLGRIEIQTASSSSGKQPLPGKPIAVEVDLAGRVLYTDEKTRRVGLVASTGRRIATFGAGALMQRPAGLAAPGLAGDLYVVDSQLKRVLWLRVP